VDIFDQDYQPVSLSSAAIQVPVCKTVFPAEAFSGKNTRETSTAFY
jgi:hypothetical protein